MSTIVSASQVDESCARLTEVCGQAARLSTEINVLSESCAHEAVSTDITNISGELHLLSTTLARLQESVKDEALVYTDAFHVDLKEIIDELTLVYEEIEECCVQLQQSDSSLKGAAWFFKKGRATKLQKHLEALKTTIVVMRTVLHHGKDYGTQLLVNPSKNL